MNSMNSMKEETHDVIQELELKFLSEGFTVFLPQNMSDRCLIYLSNEGEIFLNEPEEEPDEEHTYIALMYCILRILQYQRNGEVEISDDEFFEHAEMYAFVISLELLNRHTDMKTEPPPTLDNILKRDRPIKLAKPSMN